MRGPVYKRSEHAIFADVCDDVVALQVEPGNCFGLDGVAAGVWQLLADPRDLSAQCEALTDEYEVDPEVCRSKVGQLVEQLVAERLVPAQMDYRSCRIVEPQDVGK